MGGWASYSKLYTSESLRDQSPMENLEIPSLDEHVKDRLEEPISEIEIARAI